MTQRVNYLERQILTAEALNQEQGYRLVSHREHNLANHDWGILQGLRFDKQDDELWLVPGIAVDGYGRELFVSEPFPIRRELFTALYGEEHRRAMLIDLWLRYAREASGSSPGGTEDRDPNQRSRAREEARLCATRPPKDAEGQPAAIDPRRPSAVPAEDLDFPPFREPPDDPARSWPVYLGRVRWSTEREEATSDHRAHRPYANLVGALLRSASRQPGPEDPRALTAPAPVDRARVEMAPMLSGRAPFGVYCADPKSNLERRLAVLGSGNVRARGHMLVLSELTEQKRMQMNSHEREKGKLSTLHLKERAIRFTQSMIGQPDRLAAKIQAGELPLSADLKERARKAIEELYKQPRDTDEQKRNLREGLADLLNNIVNREPLLTSSRLPNLRLRPGTWELFRSRVKGAEFAPLNARIVKDVFSGELRGTAKLEEVYAMEVAPLGVPETKRAMPWSIYRLEKKDEAGIISTELRFESFDPGDKGDPTLYQVAIGKFEGIPTSGAFTPCLRVDAGCNVTIYGDLNVTGELSQGRVQVDPNDPRYVDQLTQSWEQGVSAALAASTSLTAIISNISFFSTAAGRFWCYDLTITNQSEMPVTSIRVLDTFANGTFISQTSELAQHPGLEPKGNIPITVRQRSSGAMTIGTKLYIVASVMGRLPTGITAYASARGEAVVER